VYFRRGQDLKEKDKQVGYTCHCRTEKNKVGVPKKNAEFIMYNDGTIDREMMLLNMCNTLGYFGKNITLTGRTYTYKDEKIASSRDDFVTYLKEHQDICDEVENDIIEFSQQPNTQQSIKKEDDGGSNGSGTEIREEVE